MAIGRMMDKVGAFLLAYITLPCCQVINIDPKAFTANVDTHKVPTIDPSLTHHPEDARHLGL